MKAAGKHIVAYNQDKADDVYGSASRLDQQFQHMGRGVDEDRPHKDQQHHREDLFRQPAVKEVTRQ
jgi:hypothetical protein